MMYPSLISIYQSKIKSASDGLSLGYLLLKTSQGPTSAFKNTLASKIPSFAEHYLQIVVH